ncbi:MAG TPA: putative Ig domain-containing protein, partial [Rhodothermales bacterium]|nr:putative Ig domain-containing protein [Rhodothermales bacterium]
TFIIQTSDEPPEARNDFYTVEQGATLRLDPPGVLENDVDNRNSGLTAELVSDVEHGTLAFEADGSFLYRNDGVQNVQDSFTYRAHDGTEKSNVATVEIAINLTGNPPPDVINPGTQSDAEGDAVSLQIQADDLDRPLTYATTNLPPGLAIDPNTGLISGLLPVGAANNSPYAVQVRVTDAQGGRTITPFQWIVTNPPPTATAPPPQTNEEGDTVSLQIQANDPGDVLTYTATGRPPDLFINPNTGVISGTLSNTAANNSPYTVTVTVTDSRDASSQVQFMWTVTNPPPEVGTPPPDQMHMEGETITPVQVEVLDDDVLTYTATGLPPDLMIDEDTGEISGTVSNTAATGSPYTVMVTATDSQGADVTTTFTWTITNAPPQVTNPGNQTNAEGDDVTLQIQASDPDVPLTYVATGLPPNLSIDENTGEISGTVSGTATSGSPYTVMITVTDSEGAETTISFTWTITNAPPQVTNPGDQTHEEGDDVMLQIQATDPDLPLSYAATGLPPSLSMDANTGEISGTIDSDAADNSPYAVEVTVTDNGGADAVITFDWTVTNPPPQVTDPGDQTDAEDEMVSLQIEALDDDANLTYAAEGLPPSLSLDANTGEISGTIDSGAASGSPYDVTITVTDAQSASTQVQFTWTVQAPNPTPTLTMVTPNMAARGTTLDVVLTGTNFVAGVSSVEFDLAIGIAINTTTVDSATQMTINITIDAGAALGNRNITVRNAAPGGGTSQSRNFTITM